ncbi:hypothetical protein [uncultured Nostoc sp.]|uniref:hypothetical protein n=1 Tax=uncultured Nostoc sp. TaxID=340711 RepID=UPI00260BB79B|nr:hypothetical protein [uncultured Nostoc sp.]
MQPNPERIGIETYKKQVWERYNGLHHICFIKCNFIENLYKSSASLKQENQVIGVEVKDCNQGTFFAPPVAQNEKSSSSKQVLLLR